MEVRLTFLFGSLLLASKSLGFLLDKCPDHSTYSPYSSCYDAQASEGPAGLTHLLKDDALAICPKPSMDDVTNGLNSIGLRYDKNASYHPIVQRMSTIGCGKCSRQLRCCVAANETNFMRQRVETVPCQTTGSAPCVLTDWPLTSNDSRTAVLAKELAEWHPDFNTSAFVANPCDFVVLWPEVEMYIDSSFYKTLTVFARKLLCAFVGTSRPTFNCKKITTKAGPQCACCCTEFEPRRIGSGFQCVYTGYHIPPNCK